MDIDQIVAQAKAAREQAVALLAELDTRRLDRRPLSDDELRDYAARFPMMNVRPRGLVRMGPAASVPAARPPVAALPAAGKTVEAGVGYVLKHRTLGVYLGKPEVGDEPVDLAWHHWSGGDRGGRMSAVTLPTLSEAQALCDRLSIHPRDGMSITRVRINAVEGPATMADCVRAGLPAWTTDGRPCIWELKNSAGNYESAEGHSLSEAAASVRRSVAILDPKRLPYLGMLEVVTCSPLSDEALHRRERWAEMGAARAAEQAALQAHNAPFVKAYLDAGADRYTEADEVGDAIDGAIRQSA